MKASLTDGEGGETLSEAPSSPSVISGSKHRRAEAPGRFWFSWSKLTCCKSSPVALLGTLVKDWKLTELKLCCMLLKRRRVPAGSRSSSSPASPAPCPCGDPQRRCVNAGEESPALSPCVPVRVPCTAASVERSRVSPQPLCSLTFASHPPSGSFGHLRLFPSARSALADFDSIRENLTNI